jgi:hypothetical protein
MSDALLDWLFGDEEVSKGTLRLQLINPADLLKGGPGSGNHNHAGIRGQRGGSMPKGQGTGGMSLPEQGLGAAMRRKAAGGGKAPKGSTAGTGGASRVMGSGTAGRQGTGYGTPDRHASAAQTRTRELQTQYAAARREVVALERQSKRLTPQGQTQLAEAKERMAGIQAELEKLGAKPIARKANSPLTAGPGSGGGKGKGKGQGEEQPKAGGGGKGKKDKKKDKPPPPIPWTPTMTPEQAAEFTAGSQMKMPLYLSTSMGLEQMGEGVPLMSDNVNAHPGITLSMSPNQSGEGNNYEVRALIQNGLSTDASFWAGTSTREDHQKIYDLAGQDRSVGNLSRAIQRAGYDAWAMMGTGGVVEKVRIFDRKRVVIVQQGGPAKSVLLALQVASLIKGGPGSGNHGHAGRKGKRGGSAPKGTGPVADATTSAIRKAIASPDDGGDYVGGFDPHSEDNGHPIARFFGGWEKLADTEGINQNYIHELKDHAATRLSEGIGVDYDSANDFVKQWATTSNDHDLRSLKIQEWAAKEFDADLTNWQRSKLSSVTEELDVALNMLGDDFLLGGSLPLDELDADQRSVLFERLRRLELREDTPPLPFWDRAVAKVAGEYDTGERTFAAGMGLAQLYGEIEAESEATTRQAVRHIYDQTQKRLADAGIDRILLYRGIEQSMHLSEGDTIEVTQNVLSSWSASRDIANRFTGDGLVDDGYLLWCRESESTLRRWMALAACMSGSSWSLVAGRIGSRWMSGSRVMAICF